ncbi:calcium-transporting ATPase 3 [Purpureocillium lavendulum]|uniref:Calcium-transporting ATPase 3 n=1 Tax=Purpureocillium lavendulum TaxID=1247861 RepID=A0AB34G1Z8_9HYPO|nr:calcium-transporting ATPase 3 [Purpureocillium lavendulum]
MFKAGLRASCMDSRPCHARSLALARARAGRSFRQRLGLAFLLCAFVAAFCTFTSEFPTLTSWPWRAEAESDGTRGFRWDDIAPSATLQYTPCFDGFQCARLSVPLNWNSTAEEQMGGPQAAIAIIKLTAKVPVTDPRYGGPVLFNPGGPGESGVYQVLSDGKSLQDLLDAPPSSSGDDGKYFDVLSFDPRGVNNTTPWLQCFTDSSDQQAWLASLPDYGLLWHSETVTGLEWARAEALGASCSDSEGDEGILRHVNTAQTVQDMVHIIEKEGELRAEEALRLISSTGNGGDRTSIMERLAYHPGKERIQYWGMSYGTLIGSTFAALHPDRVHRMVLDGVVDPADHYSGGWLTQLQDSDKILSKFCEYCYAAGPDRCPLYVNSSAVAIEARVTSILLNLKEAPIPMAVSYNDGGHTGPSLVTYGDAHLLLLSAFYFPFASLATFFDALVALESRNTSSPSLRRIVTRKHARFARPRPADGAIPYVSALGSFQAISCMDSGPLNLTRESFNGFLAELQGQSRWLGLSWARNKLACLGYGVDSAWKPPFSFKTQQWDNTSHPLLIIGNTHDTVTPLRNARRVSTLFPGSVVLQQDSQGHCSHSAPGLCTVKTIRRYFQTGELPEEGVVCKPGVRPFLGCTAEGGGRGGECVFDDAEEQRLWNVAVGLADPFGLR